MPCDTEYKRNRRNAIREGTWKFRLRPADPTVEPTESDLEWAAGFLEGEGYFARAASNSLVVTACQRYTAEPLQRLRLLFGGSIRRDDKWDRWVWGAHGKRARRVMVALWPYLSKRRQRQLAAALTIGDVAA